MVQFSCLFMTLIVVSIFWAVQTLPQSTCDVSESGCDNRLQLEAEKFVAGYRQCLLHHLNNNEVKFWNLLSSAIRLCLAREKLSKSINVITIGNRKPYDLSKYVILPSPIDSPCIAVIARDKYSAREWSAEEELVRLMPQCELHVADRNPSVPNGKIYNKFISFGEIGDENWHDFADKHGFKRYHPDMDPHDITLKNFLEKYVKAPKVDYLWIDPMKIMVFPGNRLLIPDSALHWNTIFEDGLKDVIVCQIILTIPIFIRHEGVERNEEFRALLKDMVPKIVKTSPILPIHSKYSQKTGMLRTSFLNMTSPYCLKKYLAPDFCGKEACSVDQKFEKSKEIENEWKHFQENLKKFENDLGKIEDEFEEMIGE